MAPEVPAAPVVFRIPMRTRFRGQTVREGVLLQGPAGWGEFSPFPEYGPRESARWLACAREAAFEGWPEPVRVVEACGLPAVVSSAVETSVGLAAGLALAAALPALPYACGLGTAPLLSGDVVADPLVPVGGRLAVRRPAVDFQHLSAFEIESPQWLRRMQEASR
jgi:L-alanine-DL-glutamate epimerase-like enolase superfamily enzyme